jgi:hypothetical protein
MNIKPYESLIFLLSMPRSGSTLFSLMLGSHPEIYCPPEPWIVLAAAEYFDLGKVRDIPYGREWAEIAAIEFLLNLERKQRGVLGRALRNIGETSHLDNIVKAKRILQVVYQLHLDASGAKIFIDKTPRNYVALDLIGEIFPRTKKIVLLRNPLDIFASYKATWEISRSIFTPEGVAVHTRDFSEGLFTLANYITFTKDDIFVLRYEDLVNTPEDALRSACKFANIDFSPRMLAYYENTILIEEYRKSPVGDPISSSRPSPTSNQTVNAWEKRLELADIQALINVIGVNIFERLGYSDTIEKLRQLSINIPTEEQALDCRKVLMLSLVDGVHEQPFSIWNNFISPLRESLADRAARLEVIQQLQIELKASEADRAARLEVIQQQQQVLNQMRTISGFSNYLLKKLRDRVYGSFKK